MRKPIEIRAEISALALEKKRLHWEISDLESELIQAEYHEVDLPNEDGWYLTAADTIARREDGIWHDGWGNHGPDYDSPAWSPLPLRRLREES